LLIATLVFGKMLITGGALLASGVDHWTATRAAIVLAQMGEFSFVLAGVGFAEEIIGDDQYGLILTAAIGSIFLMPILLAGAPTMTSIALRMPFVEFREGRWITPIGKEVYDTGHVVICGYGRIGSELARSLDAQNIHYAVVDINPAMVRLLRERGTWSAFGDATEEHILRTLGIARAKTVAITIPDMVGARSIIRLAREINPGIAVIARAMNANQVESISDQGANEVVQPEFEAAMEFARQVLTWHGIEEDVAIADITQRRAQVYRLAIDVAEPPSSARAVQVDDRVTLVG